MKVGRSGKKERALRRQGSHPYAAAALLLIVCALALPAANCSKLPASIRFRAPELFPSGLAWDASRHKFLVTSLRLGELGLVSDEGRYQAFVQDASLVSTHSVMVDRERERIIACNDDSGLSVRSGPDDRPRPGELLVMEYNSGRIVERRPIPGTPGRCTQVALSGSGRVLVADGRRGAIYELSASFDLNPLTASSMLVGLTALVAGEGYLLVARRDTPSLLRIDLADPGAVTPVGGGRTLHHLRSLVLLDSSSVVTIMEPPDRMAGTEGSGGRAARLTTTDAWRTAGVAAEIELGPGWPAAAALREGRPYVVFSYEHLLHQEEPGPAQFRVDSMPLDD